MKKLQMTSHSDHWIKRYCDAHRLNFIREYPTAFKDGHYTPPVLPQINKSNGLTLAIVNFLNWSGNNATRINTMGRPVEGFKDGFKVLKYMPSMTRKGTADITATIRGRSVKIEIKTGTDKPRDEQIKEQARERSAGGIYEFIGTMEAFFDLYDGLHPETNVKNVKR